MKFAVEQSGTHRAELNSLLIKGAPPWPDGDVRIMAIPEGERIHPKRMIPLVAD
jgi:hypothetical protein